MPGIHNGIGTTFRSQAFGGGAAPVNPNFVFTVDTTQSGSAADTIVLPLLSGGTYSGTIDWGDTSTSSLSYANRSHTYASGGTYTITISGDTFEGWQVANSGDKLKFTEIQNWGFFTITNDRTFDYCQNLDVTATDAPIITTSSFYSIFRNCDSLTTPDFSGWDTSSVTNMQEAFSGSALFNSNISNWVTVSTTNIKQMLAACTSFNQDLSTWDTSGVTNAEGVLSAATSFNSSVANWVLNGTWFRPFNGATAFTGIGVDTWDVSGMTSGMNLFVNCVAFNGDTSGWDTGSLLTATNMFYNCDSYDQDMSSWDINQVTGLSGFMQNALGLSTSNYDALLVGWEADLQAAYPGGAGYPHTINVNFGGSQFTSGGAGETAKNSLVSNFGWTITDGGGI